MRLSDGEQGLSSRTIKRRLATLSGLFGFLVMLEEMPVGEAAAMVGVEPRQLRMRKLRGMKALAPVMRAWLDEHATV